MHENLVSVIIPSYNYETYIRQAIFSVASQTYPEIELVIVDDCSTDSSYELVRQLAADKKLIERFAGNIQIFKNEKNLGANETINFGILKATGNYIAVLNADDLYEANRIQTLIGDMKAHNAQLAFSSVKCIDANGDPLEKAQAETFETVQRHIKGKAFMALTALSENVSISTGNLLFTKDLFFRLYGFKKYKYVHDYDFFARACLMTEPVFTGRTAYRYRIHGENTFMGLQKVGVRENRMLWLDLYWQIRKGAIENKHILETPDYEALFYDEITRAGKKKQTLWKLSTNPFARFAMVLMKLRYKIN